MWYNSDMAETNIQPVERRPGPTPEVPRIPEARPESKPEVLPQSETPADRAAEQPVVSIPPNTTGLVPPPAASLFVQEVEQVMTEGLDETYRQLDASTQVRFKQAGEQTAQTIAGLLEETKVQARKVLELLVAWLRIIPGVNKFFLEQEAKIKADKLLALRRPRP